MTDHTANILILGAGSVGRRHALNLAALGCRISAFDPRRDRLEELADALACSASFGDLDQALDQDGLDGVVVASPPSVHVEQALRCVARGLPILIEKPVSPDLESAERLAAAAADRRVPALVGYTWRWWPSIRSLRNMVLGGSVGRPLSVRCVLSAHLADWHPWERYQDFFMAKAAEGGGALLDESHFIDLMLWFQGIPLAVWSDVSRISDLEIDSDDHVDACWRAPSGARVSLHLDLYGRPHARSITVVGTEGTIEWTPRLVRIGAGPDDWAEQRFNDERNDMFVAEAAEFVDIVRGKMPPSCTLADGVDVLRVIEAMRRSSISGAIEEV